MSQATPSVFVNSNEEGVQRVQKANGKYAFFMESTSIEYQVERKCDLQQVGGTLDSKGYGIGLPVSEYDAPRYCGAPSYARDAASAVRLSVADSPYRTKVNGALLKLQEKGVLQELKEKWWKAPANESCSEVSVIASRVTRRPTLLNARDTLTVALPAEGRQRRRRGQQQAGAGQRGRRLRGADRGDAHRLLRGRTRAAVELPQDRRAGEGTYGPRVAAVPFPL